MFMGHHTYSVYVLIIFLYNAVNRIHVYTISIYSSQGVIYIGKHTLTVSEILPLLALKGVTGYVR